MELGKFYIISKFLGTWVQESYVHELLYFYILILIVSHVQRVAVIDLGLTKEHKLV